MRTSIITLAFAFAAATAAPALANADTCSVAPEQLRAIAVNADAKVANRAERNIRLGEALCDARNRSEATRKFKLAAKTLDANFDEVVNAAATPAAATAQ